MLPPQSASAVQPRHVPVAVAQTGVVPVHRELSLAEQTPQTPLGWQTGVAPPQSASAVQPRQVPDETLQTGVVPLHCASDTQVTQVAVPVLQTGVVPVHFDVLVAEQAPHAPLG